MKIIRHLAIVIGIAGTLAISSCAGSYYVTDQPVEPVYERPVSPYAGAIWIDGDWIWNGGGYHYNRGHWDRPRPGRTYYHGSWQHTNRGYTWNHGGWRR